MEVVVNGTEMKSSVHSALAMGPRKIAFIESTVSTMPLGLIFLYLFTCVMSAHEGIIKTTDQTKTPTNIVICGRNTTKFIPHSQD